MILLRLLITYSRLQTRQSSVVEKVSLDFMTQTLLKSVMLNTGMLYIFYEYANWVLKEGFIDRWTTTMKQNELTMRTNCIVANSVCFAFYLGVFY